MNNRGMSKYPEILKFIPDDFDITTNGILDVAEGVEICRYIYQLSLEGS